MEGRREVSLCGKRTLGSTRHGAAGALAKQQDSYNALLVLEIERIKRGTDRREWSTRRRLALNEVQGWGQCLEGTLLTTALVPASHPDTCFTPGFVTP